MRRVIACKACRSRKVKCLHDGKPPCRACRSNGKELDCELTYPVTTPTSKPKRLKFVSMNKGDDEDVQEVSKDSSPQLIHSKSHTLTHTSTSKSTSKKTGKTPDNDPPKFINHGTNGADVFPSIVSSPLKRIVDTDRHQLVSNGQHQIQHQIQHQSYHNPHGPHPSTSSSLRNSSTPRANSAGQRLSAILNSNEHFASAASTSSSPGPPASLPSAPQLPPSSMLPSKSTIPPMSAAVPSISAAQPMSTAHKSSGSPSSSALPPQSSSASYQTRLERSPDAEADFLNAIPDTTVYRACELVARNLKELIFLHEPTLLFETKTISCHLKSVILALCGAFTPIPNDPHLSKDSPYVKNEVYYRYVTKELLSPSTLISEPNIKTIQSLVMLALYDWGKDRYYSSWMVHGIACRMLQTFGLFSATSTEEAIAKCQKSGQSQLDCELLVRTYWSCFLVDRIIDSGKNRSFCFDSSNYRIVHLPASEENFLLMSNSVDAPQQSSQAHISLGTYKKILNFGYQNRGASYLISIFEIWGRITDFLLLGGRVTFREPPFQPNSFSSSIKTSLAEWIGCLPEHWKWSNDRYRAHTIMKSEVTFVMINVLYHLCYLYINREYIPFLPHSNDYPVGPVEPPLLPPAPDKDYWMNSARELFNNTRKLSSILLYICSSEASDVCYTLASPFFLFCIFSALATGFYGSAFTWMDPDHMTYECKQDGDLGEMSRKLLKYLDSKNESAQLSSNWCKTARQLIELYDAVAGDRGKARELKLGRHSFDNLEDSIQIVNSSEKLLPEEKNNETTSESSRQQKIQEYTRHVSINKASPIGTTASLDQNGMSRNSFFESPPTDEIHANFPPNILDFFLLGSDEASRDHFSKVIKDFNSN